MIKILNRKVAEEMTRKIEMFGHRMHFDKDAKYKESRNIYEEHKAT